MAFTLTQLEAKVVHKLGLTASDGMLTNLVESINTGLSALATEYDWPWLVRQETFSTAQGDDLYDTPEGWTRTRWLTINGAKLTSVQSEEVAAWNDETDTPAEFCELNGQLQFGPTPNAVYTVKHEYVIGENTLEDGTDTVLCPDAYIDVVVTYAALEEATRIKDVTLAGMLEKRKSDWIKRLQDNIKRTKDLPEISTRRDW